MRRPNFWSELCFPQTQRNENGKGRSVLLYTVYYHELTVQQNSIFQVLPLGLFCNLFSINKFIVQGPMALIRPLLSVHNDFYDLPPPINVRERFIPTKRGQCDHDLLD